TSGMMPLTRRAPWGSSFRNSPDPAPQLPAGRTLLRSVAADPHGARYRSDRARRMRFSSLERATAAELDGVRPCERAPQGLDGPNRKGLAPARAGSSKNHGANSGRLT